MAESCIQKALGDRLLIDLLGDKWTCLVLANLCMDGNPIRFNALKRGVPGISQKSLTQCLRRLERNGLVERRVTADRVLAVEYAFTPLGKSISLPIIAIYEWTANNGAAVRRAQAKFDRNVDVNA